MSTLASILSRIGRNAWLGLVIAGAVLAALASVKRAGVMEERGRQRIREIEGGFARRRIEAEVQSANHTGLDDMLRPPRCRRLR